jgi:hypothetical protein
MGIKEVGLKPFTDQKPGTSVFTPPSAHLYQLTI